MTQIKDGILSDYANTNKVNLKRDYTPEEKLMIKNWLKKNKATQIPHNESKHHVKKRRYPQSFS